MVAILREADKSSVTEARIETALIDPESWRNGANESFNDKLRGECLSLEWFRSRREAKIGVKAWRHHYHTVRPYMSLGYLTPLQLMQRHDSLSDRQPGAVSRNERLEISRANQNLSKSCRNGRNRYE